MVVSSGSTMTRRMIARACVTLLAALVALAVGCAGVALGAEPTIAISQPHTGFSTNAQTPTFSGTTNDALDPVTLDVYVGSSATGTPVQEPTLLAPTEVAPGEATWEITPSAPLAPGEYTAVAVQTNAALEQGASAPVTFTIDTTAPAVTINPVASPTKEPKPTLTGAAGVEAGDEPAVIVTIYDGTSAGGTVAASEAVTASGGKWSYSPKTSLSEGAYTAQATQSDEAGNTGKSAAVTFTVDTTAPLVTMNAVASPSKDTTPTLTGAAGNAAGDIASVAVSIHEGTTVSGKVVASGAATVTGASWSYAAASLSDGTYTAQATQKDTAGNIGKSAAITFTIDTTPPAVTVHAVPSPTNDAEPTLTGAAGVASGDVATVTVTIYHGSVVGGTVAATGGAIVKDAEWAFKAPHLSDGTYTVQATQSDTAGNIGKSAPVTFTLETVAPAVSMNPVASPTNNATPTLTGGAGVAPADHPTVTVTIYDGSVVGGTVATTGSATVSGAEWSFKSPHLSDGTYTAQAAQSDEAGNVGTSAPVTFTVDTTAPAVSIKAVASPTKEATPTLTGAAGTAAGDIAAVTVSIHEGTVSGPVVASGAATVTGATWTYTAAKLNDVTYTVQATQKDQAGNTGTSAASTFTVDTTAPVVTINPAASPTNDATPTLAGAAGVAVGDIASVTVSIHEGTVSGPVVASGAATVTGATWSYTAAKLNDGAYTVQATQKDEAGNLGKSAAVTFTVDTTAPVVTVNPVASPTNDATPTLGGVAGVLPRDLASVTVTVYEGPSVSGKVVATGAATVTGASWSYTPATLSDATYTVQATQKDEAGNVGKSAAVTFIVDTTKPVVTMNALAPPLNTSEPTLTGAAGVAQGDDASVTVTIHEGASVAGKIVASGGVTVTAGSWSYTTPHLADGTYTAQAAQSDDAGNVGTSATVTFKTPPSVSVSSPAAGNSLNVSRPTFSGLAGSASGDESTVTLKIYDGASVSGTLAETVNAKREGGHWTVTGAPLANGEYTVQAEQSDNTDNVAKSEPVTFEVSATVTLDESDFTERGGELLTGPTPRFTGTAGTAAGDGAVVVTLYHGEEGTLGEVVTGTPLEGIPDASGAWSVGPLPALAEGTYTVRAEQKEGHVTHVEEVVFTVDAAAPKPTITSPANGSSAAASSQAVGGTAGTDAGDVAAVNVHLYAGAAATGTPLQSVAGHVSGGLWSVTFTGLAPGTYTVEGEQSNDVGDVGHSAAVTFTLTEPPPTVTTPTTPTTTTAETTPAVTPSAPPAASFRWVPASPHPGEPVTLISTSTDASSPITGFAWASGASGAFTAGESALTTSFATAGSYVEQLRVTDAGGRSSTVAETIQVTSPAAALIQPFPIVRMAGSFDAAGVKISLLTVQAPPGATVTVKCHGVGCPTRSETLVAASGAKVKAGTVVITLRRFERPLHAGTTLVVEVSDHGEIGKYTRFVIRHNKLPSRQDLCLNPAGTTPIQCPS